MHGPASPQRAGGHAHLPAFAEFGEMRSGALPWHPRPGRGSVSRRNGETGAVTDIEGTVWFTALKFGCRVCGLRLDSAPQVAAAGMEPRWRVVDADWRDYEPPFDEDAVYEPWYDR